MSIYGFSGMTAWFGMFKKGSEFLTNHAKGSCMALQGASQQEEKDFADDPCRPWSTVRHSLHQIRRLVSRLPETLS